MSNIKKFKRSEIYNRDTKTETIFIIDNEVYDVTGFLDNHPGGHELLLDAAGKDASEDFNDVGHSSDARELMKKYVIGELVEEDKVAVKKRKPSWVDIKPEPESEGFLSSWKFPVMLGLIMTILYTYVFG